MSWQRSLAVWLVASPLYVFVCLEKIERHFWRHPYVFVTVTIAGGMAWWFWAARRRPRSLILAAIFAPLLGAVVAYWVTLLVYWWDVGTLSPPIGAVDGIVVSLMAIGLSKAPVLSLLLLVVALWETKGRQVLLK